MVKKETKKNVVGDEQICRKRTGKWRCKSESSDNKLRFCENHYKEFEDFCRNKTTKKKDEKLNNTSGDVEGAGSGCSARGVGSKSGNKVTDPTLDGIQLPTTHNVGTTRENDFTDLLTEDPTLITSNKMKKKLPPDEQRCGRDGSGGWRCKNYRMGHGAGNNDATVPKTKFCEKHYILRAKYYENLKKRSRDGEGAGTGHIEETRGSGRRKNVSEEDDGTEIQYPVATNHDNTSNMECGSANAGTKRKNVETTSNKSRKKQMEKKKLPPDEQYCCQTAGKVWRCKNFRMGHGAAADDANVPKTKYCEKHYNLHARYRKKFLPKRSGDGGGSDAGCSTGTAPLEIRRSKRMKPATEEDDTRENQPATSDNTSNTIVEDGGSPRFGMKRKRVEKAQRSGDLKSFKKIGEAVVDLESLQHYKSKCFELTVELDNQKMELQKKNVEYTTLQRKYAELETKKTAAEDEDAVKYWRNKCSNLESLILRMEIENPRMQCGVSRVSNLESLVTRNGKETSVSRCEELRNCGKIESEVQGSQHEITESGETQRYKDNMSTLNAETSSGGREDSRVYELKADASKHHKSESELPKYSALKISSGSLHLASGGENVEETKGSGFLEGRPFNLASSSQGHLKMSKRNFVNLVSDSDDESVDSLGDPMDMMATENWNRNKHEMKWKSEVDMLSSLEEDPELCLKAVCALYRQEISEDEISPKGLVIDSDTLRCATLAQFLMGEDCTGDLKKSVAELEKFDSKAVGDCKKLVRRYSMYLFDIYENRKDPFFVPATNASNGDKTAK